MAAGDQPLEMREADAVDMGRVSGFDALLGAIAAVMPDGSVLCLEGTATAAEVAAFLDAHGPADPPAVRRNTLWPRPRQFHLPITPATMAELQALVRRHAEPEVADHLVVYRGDEVLLWAHDAGDGYVTVSRRLGDDAIDRFRGALGDALR